jgi:hypothetical protein
MDDQSIRQGEPDKMLVTSIRDNFYDPVRISLQELPQGVELLDKAVVIPAGSNTVTLTIKVTADADVGEHDVKLVA